MARLRILGSMLTVLALAALAALAPPLGAQAGGAPPAPHESTHSYRPPTIALVQPASGGGVPLEKPVVVFRLAAGEPGDPLELTSFRVAVDGSDRTALFQVTASEAWGPLAGPSDLSESADPDEPPRLTPGMHQLTARICSVRGACSAVTSVVAVLPAIEAEPPARPSSSRRKQLIDLLLEAAKRLLAP